MFRATVTLTALIVLSAIGFGLIAAQERPDRPTRAWRAHELPKVDWRAGGVIVDIIDTEGVCLYITRTDGEAKAPALAAVPKTQLPPGAGCQ